MTGKVPQYLSWWQDNANTKEGRELFARCLSDYCIPHQKEIRKHIADSGYKSVLDCGAGLCQAYFGFKADAYEIVYHAIDITPDFVDRGKKENINIKHAPIENIPHADNSIDVCLCLDVLNHLFDFKKPIDEMLRVARNEVIISLQHQFRPEPSMSVRYYNEDNVTLIYNFFTKQAFVDYFESKNVECEFRELSRGAKTGLEKKNVLFVKKKNDR